MEVLVLDENFRAIEILDTSKSLIWTDRYSAYGDFEITIAAEKELLAVLKEGNYLELKESEHSMIIEDLIIKTDVEAGDTFYFTGRSLESILTYRIIWQQTILTGNLQNGIKKLLNENAITPTDTKRKIDNLIFEMSDDPAVTSLTVNAQFTGDNLYDAVKGICDAEQIGFKITLSDNNKFIFKLYSGKDRSYDQLINPYVVFSPEFDNIINSEYAASRQGLKTVALVAGEGEGIERKTTTVESGNATGLTRREMFVDAREISSSVDGGTLTNEEYENQLKEKGNIQLAENNITKVFEGEVDFIKMFKYNEDFFMGDVVQLRNKYDIESKSRVTEVIYSQDTEGIAIYPTFVVKE